MQADEPAIVSWEAKDHLNQAHRFLLTIDQSYLPEVLRGCERLLDQYPVRN